jgi:TP901 family phage tail tape measure protein
VPREIFKLFGTITANGLDGVSGALKSIDSQFKQADKALVKFGRQSVKIGTTMTKNLTVPIVALGAVVTKFGADFEKSMQTSISIMGDVSAETRAQMEKTARSIAKETTVSANDAAKAYYFLSSAGYSAAASIGALPLVTKFAMAGQIGLEEATSLLADAQNALGLKVDDNVKNTENLVRVTDVLSQANNIANGSVRDFSLALANKGAAAIKMLNKDIEEGVAVLAAYASVGVKAEEGGEKLNIVLRDLQTAAIKQKPAFAKLGISVYDASGKMRNMADIIGDLEKSFSGMSDEEKRTTLMTLGFQDRSVAATMQLLGMSDAIRDYEAKLRSAGGVTADVASKQMKNFWDQLTIVKNKLVDVGITLYQTLQPILMDTVIPALENASGKVAALANWFSLLDDSTKKNIIAIIAITAAAGPLILIIGKSILIIKSLTVAFALARTAAIGLTIAMATNPFIAVIAGAATLVAALVGVKTAYDNLDKSRKKVHKSVIDESAELKKLRFDWQEELNWLERQKKPSQDMINRMADLRDGIKSITGSIGDLNKTKIKSPIVDSIDNKNESEVKTNEEYVRWLSEERKFVELMEQAHRERIDGEKKINDELKSVRQENIDNLSDNLAEEGRISLENWVKNERDERTHIETLTAIYASMSEQIGDNIASAFEDGEINLKKMFKEILKTFLSFIEKLMVGAIFANAANKFITAGPIGLIIAALEATGLIAAFEIAKAKISTFSEGGLIRGGRGGVVGQIGESREDELITPMESGVDIFARKIVDASRRMFGAGSPGLAFAGAAGGYQRAQENHWYIGTLVADDRGLKEMERRLGGFRVSEAQRKGQMV